MRLTARERSHSQRSSSSNQASSRRRGRSASRSPLGAKAHRPRTSRAPHRGGAASSATGPQTSGKGELVGKRQRTHKGCLCCGSPLHTKDDCPNARECCGHCGRVGHTVATCRTRKRAERAELEAPPRCRGCRRGLTAPETSLGMGKCEDCDQAVLWELEEAKKRQQPSPSSTPWRMKQAAEAAEAMSAGPRPPNRHHRPNGHRRGMQQE